MRNHTLLKENLKLNRTRKKIALKRPQASLCDLYRMRGLVYTDPFPSQLLRGNQSGTRPTKAVQNQVAGIG